jgi:predicted transcriptional regulator
MKPARPLFLGDLELAVMDHLWSHGGKDAKAVHDLVGRGRRITLNTIQSTLKRLFEKGLLEREKVSHAHVYTPRVSRAEFHRDALQNVVQSVMGGESAAMLSAFVGVAERVGPEQLEQLEQLIADRLRDRRKAEGSR